MIVGLSLIPHYLVPVPARALSLSLLLLGMILFGVLIRKGYGRLSTFMTMLVLGILFFQVLLPIVSIVGDVFWGSVFLLIIGGVVAITELASKMVPNSESKELDPYDAVRKGLVNLVTIATAVTIITLGLMTRSVDAPNAILASYEFLVGIVVVIHGYTGFKLKVTRVGLRLYAIAPLLVALGLNAISSSRPQSTQLFPIESVMAAVYALIMFVLTGWFGLRPNDRTPID